MLEIKGVREGFLYLLIFVLFSISVSAAACGDGVGFCSCGDAVTASVTLNESHLVTQGMCNGTALNVQEHGIIIDGNLTTIEGNASGYGINVSHFNNVVIRNFGLVRNFTNALFLFNMTYSTVFNNTFEGANVDQGYVVYGEFNSNASYNNFTQNNITTGNHSYGAVWISHSQGNVFDRNVIASLGEGPDMASAYGLALSDGLGGHNITNNVITSYASHALFLLTGENNSRIESNVVTTYSSGMGDAIHISESGFSVVVNNTAWSDLSSGIGLSGSQNITVERNNAYGGTAGIQLWDVVNSTLLNNTFKTNTGVGVVLGDTVGGVDNSHDNHVEENTIWTNVSWIVSGTNALRNNLTRNHFVNVHGNLTLLDNNISLSGAFNATVELVNISANYTFIDSSQLLAFNKTAQISLNGITFSNPQVVEDPDGDGVFTSCSSCTENGFSGGVFTFTVPHFSAYSSDESPPASTCGTITTDTTLLNNIDHIASGDCFTINADDVTLDCDGYMVYYGGNNGANENAVTATSFDNIVIQNCHFIGNGSSTANRHAILLDDVDYALIHNNTIISNGSGSSSGIYLDGSTQYFNITHNYIRSTGAPGSDNNYALALDSTFNDYGTVVNNTIISEGDANNYGIYGDGIHFTLISQNVIISEGIRDSPAIYLAGANTNVTSNVLVGGYWTDSYVIDVRQSSSRHFIVGNNITSRSNVSSVPHVRFYGGSDIVFEDNVLSVNRTFEQNYTWLATSTANFFDYANFTNTTFVTPHGSITIYNNFSFFDDFELNGSDLDISHNFSYVNTWTWPGLNQSARVSLNGITFTDPQPLFSLGNGSGPFSVCHDCVNISYVGNVMTFNVSHFSGYAVRDDPGSECGSIYRPMVLRNNVSSLNSCFSVDADNVEIDCDGYAIFYDNAGSGSQYAVNATNRENITVKNCHIFDNSTGGTGSFGIYFTGVNDATIDNNTIKTNGTASSKGIVLSSGSGGVISNNAIWTYGGDSNNDGIEILSSGSAYSIINNTIITDGTDNSNNGISLSSSSQDILISSNLIIADGLGSSHKGVLLRGTGHNLTLNDIVAGRGEDSNALHFSTSAADITADYNNLSSNSSLSPVVYVQIGTGHLLTNTTFAFVFYKISFRQKSQQHLTLQIQPLLLHMEALILKGCLT